MISGQRLFPNLIIVLMISFFLAGCVRPVPDNATAVSPEPDTSDPDVGGGTLLDPTEVPHTAPPAYPADTGVAPEVVAESDPASEATNTADDATTTEAEQVAEGTAVVVEDTEEAEVTATPEAAAETATEETEAQPAEATETTIEETEVQPADSSAETTTSSSECPQEHIVQPGENLFRIGLQYGLSWVTLAQYNGITNPNNIIVGQTIKIPCAATTPPVQPTPLPDEVTTYTVQPGDNLFRIGLKFGVSWVEIAEANGLVSPNQIYTGQVLKIPASVPGPRPEFTHVVKTGETVYSISVQYGISATALAEANNLQEPYVIYAGQTLIIPGNS